MKAKKILQEILADTNHNYNSFASSIGLTRSQGLYDIRDGKVKSVSSRLAKDIKTHYPNYKIEWLLTGELPKFEDEANLQKEVKRTIEAVPRHVVPDKEIFQGNTDKYAYSEEGIEAMRVNIVPAKAQMGYLRGFADPEYLENLDFEIIPVEREYKGAYLGFETIGYSMVNLTSEQWAEKSIFPKRIAIAREVMRIHWTSKLHLHNYDAWVIVHKTDGILLKEIINHDIEKGLITIHSWNPDKETYPDDTLSLENIHQLFCVVRVIDKRR